ncbi:MAG: SDR family NAD(P)-dependent oxidoreductase [Alphaproteobacteria bacterium]|nr:SDR family NAD(P)-dependent oxidoreductase [Alphaproteobacteria bacterium]
MKLAVVTGASSGIGAATARALAGAGYEVILVARSSDKLAALAAEIGDCARAVALDAAKPEAMARLVSALPDGVLAPDLIVNAAGAGVWKTLEQTSGEEAREMMDAPYFAAFNVTRAFLVAMRARGSGVIIHVNSPAYALSWPSSAAYTAARAALFGLHRALAQDLVGSGVKSCHVTFGKVNSAYFVNNPGTEEHIPALARTVPTLEVEHCATLIVGLAARPRYNAVFPRLLRVYMGLATAFPALVRWLLRF